MPQRPIPTALQLIKNQTKNRKPVERGTPVRSGKQKMPRAPSHFTDEEKRAWKDVVKPLCEHGQWSDHLALWAENFAYMQATQRGSDRNDPNFKVNRAQLRLYARDLQMMIEFPDTSQGRSRSLELNPFDDVAPRRR